MKKPSEHWPLHVSIPVVLPGKMLWRFGLQVVLCVGFVCSIVSNSFSWSVCDVFGCTVSDLHFVLQNDCIGKPGIDPSGEIRMACCVLLDRCSSSVKFSCNLHKNQSTFYCEANF